MSYAIRRATISADEIVDCYEYIERDDLPYWEIEIRVKCWIYPGSNGATGEYGEPTEPSYTPCVEDFEPVEARFVGEEWEDYEEFVFRWGLEYEINFDREELFELCAEQKSKRHVDITRSQEARQ